jgi:hypothetical protein
MTYIPSALRQLVYARARACCEYCLIPEAMSLAPHEIDHIIAEKHGGATTEDNLALSCTLCNKHKGSDVASVDASSQEIVRLYHPRQDAWGDHFELQDGALVGLTPIGRVTTTLLKVNRAERIEERQLLLVSRLLHIPD